MIECQEEGAFSFPELETLVDELIQAFEVKRGLSSSSIFSPLSSHDQLVMDLKAYLKQNPRKVSSAFMRHIESERNYSLALRNACSWGNGELVKLIMSYSDRLPIDFNQASSNGKTPLMWWDTSTAASAEKEEITDLLKEKMGSEKSMELN